MGGILSSPKAPQMPAPPVQPVFDPSADATEARAELIERRRRGRSGTVQTSDRGLVSLNAKAPQKKTLLGE